MTEVKKAAARNLGHEMHGAKIHRRQEQKRIKEFIKRTQELNKQPSPTGSPRAARLARNRYRNQSNPVYPKTIYPEVLPTGNYKRFYGGIPR